MTQDQKQTRLFTPSMLRQEAQEKTLIVYRGSVYDLGRFMLVHPGGQTAIQRQNGKDSTDAIEAFHPKIDVQKRIKPYFVAQYSTEELEEEVETDSGVSSASSSTEQDARTAASYRLLHDRLKREGFYEPHVWFYVRQLACFAFILSAAISLACYFPNNTLALIVSAVMIGVVWHGLSFVVHDAGHHAVSGDRKIDDVFGCVVASFVGGLSVQWWTLNHNVHHIVTNDPEHDPDIQHLPLFAVSVRFFDSLYSSFHKRRMPFDAFSRVAVSVQHYLYYPVMSLGRFNLYAQSINHLLNFTHPDSKKYRWLELAGMAFFWSWFGYGVLGQVVQGFWHKVMFLYVSHAATMILHVQITLSHFAMSTECDDDDELFAVKAVRTTMNVDCPEWLDWFHGGLQFQIEHHLFPRVPRYHFRRLQVLVREFCAENKLEYHCDNFLKSNWIVLDSLKAIANQVSTYTANELKRVD